MKFLSRHKGVSLIILFCFAVLVMVVIAVNLFEYKTNRPMVDAKETLGAFSSYYGAIFGGILSGVIAIGGVFLSLYFYQERYREEDIAKVRPFLKLETTNPNLSNKMSYLSFLYSGLSLTDIKDPVNAAYPVVMNAKNIGNGYLKMDRIYALGDVNESHGLSYVLGIGDSEEITILIEKSKRSEAFRFVIEYYDSMNNLYEQEYVLKWEETQNYIVESQGPQIK